MSVVTDEQAERFIALFGGVEDFTAAFGTGNGAWVKRPLHSADVRAHLEGRGPGIGLPPLRSDSKCLFAAIDLDEPDFEAAREMQRYIPGVSWIEKSRSGNAHVWVFFTDPIDAYIPMGILKEATLAAEKEGVEVFPKNHDFSKVRLGNYINLPYHGDQRRVMDFGTALSDEDWLDLPDFLTLANGHRNDSKDWRKKAVWLSINDPGQRESTSTFGEQRMLHRCAEHVLSGDAGPITEGHRNAVFFMLASCLSNWQDVDHDEALMLMRTVNKDLCDPPESDSELRRILGNVERAGYTSTRCDDPLVLPFSHPDCPIAHPRR